MELVMDDLDLICLWVKERGEDWSASANSDFKARGENCTSCWEESLQTLTLRFIRMAHLFNFIKLGFHQILTSSSIVRIIFVVLYGMSVQEMDDN